MYLLFWGFAGVSATSSSLCTLLLISSLLVSPDSPGIDFNLHRIHWLFPPFFIDLSSLSDEYGLGIVLGVGVQDDRHGSYLGLAHGLAVETGCE